MSIPNKIFLYYLTETASGKCFFINSAGNVDLSNDVSNFLDQSPEGWLENEISFGRNTKYYGLNRTFTIPLKFVGDGAKIIRYHLYQGKGIEAPLSLIILKWNPDNDTFELYYSGELDLTKATDSAEGISVNVMEGGIVKLLKTYENTVFEFPLDGTIPENILVSIDGLKLTDTFFYQINEYTINAPCAMSVAFINNIGDNIGIEKGTQDFENSGTLSSYVTTSNNCFFSTAFATTINISGTLSFFYGGGLFGLPGNFAIWTSLGQKFDIINATFTRGTSRVIPFNIPITLSPGEKLFFVADIRGAESYSIKQTSFQIDLITRMPATTTWAVTAKDLFKLLVQKIGGGKYLAQSTLLDAWPNLALTSGFALRGDPKAVLKTSLSDFWESFNAELNASLSNIRNMGGNDTVFFESKGYVFDPSSVNIALGEVSNFKISIAADYFYSTLKIGYPPQTYDEKSGQSEWNTTYQWQAPITKESKELSLISKYRADSYGIEFVRFLYGGKSTTNNSADSDIFILNIDQSSGSARFFNATSTLTNTYTLPSTVVFDSHTGNDFTSTDNAHFTFAGASAQSVTLSVSAQLKKSDNLQASLKVYRNADVLYTITQDADGSTFDTSLAVVLNPSDVIKVNVEYVAGVTSVDVNFPNLTISFNGQVTYNLKRKTYSSVSGIPNPDAAYNVEDVTPKRMMARHFNFLKSTVSNLAPAQVKFLTCDKNPSLSTTVAGVTVTESADVPITSMGDPLFYPLLFQFDTKIPLNFINIYNAAANGHISFQYNGKTYYGFPLEVKARPALNESQSWKLLCSPMTDLADLLSLDIDGLNFLDMAALSVFISHLCPVKFVPLEVNFPAQYHFKHMDSDWFTEQIQFWANRKGYSQKWQKNDSINLQFITNGLGPVQVQIIDSAGKNVGSPVSIPQVTTTALTAPKQLFQQIIDPSTLADGTYFMVLTAGTGGTTVQYVSEPLEVKNDHPMTLLFEYFHRTNKQSTLFHPVTDGSADYTPSIRVEGWISGFSPEAKFATYEDQLANIELQNGIPYRKFKLHLAINDGLPDWMIDKISRVLLLSSCKIDGVYYSRDADAKFEVETVNGSPKKFWTIDIREAKTSEGISVNTDGLLDENITVVYNINTKGFGDGSSGTVEVTKIA